MNAPQITDFVIASHHGLPRGRKDTARRTLGCRYPAPCDAGSARSVLSVEAPAIQSS